MEKPITSETMELIACTLMRRLHDDRHGGCTPPERQIDIRQVCVAIAECGISPEVLARACAVELGGWSHSRSDYDDLDQGLAEALGEDFSAAFIERLSLIENHFGKAGLWVS